MFFDSRVDAGRQLASILTQDEPALYRGATVLGVARGGVIVGAEVAKALELPLYALCADDVTASDGTLVMATDGTAGWFPKGAQFGTIPQFVPDVTQLGLAGVDAMLGVLQEREQSFNGGPLPEYNGHVVLCDDGLVTGRTVLTLISALRRGHPDRRITLAIPVVLPWIYEADYGVTVRTWRKSTMTNAPTGMFYYEFGDTPDEDVRSAILGAR